MSAFKVIQGGMGVGVSNWRLARTVSMASQLGVVSGTGLACLLARRLQDGDEGGHMRRGLAAFPFPKLAAAIIDRYFLAEGRRPDAPYRLSPMPQVHCAESLTQLTVAANFVEVFLAKEGHHGVVGINFLEKIQTPTLASIYGAMLAGVDFILMGAGIPRMIPGVLDAYAAGMAAELRMDVDGAAADQASMSRFDPAEFTGEKAPAPKRPKFFAIISSATLAVTLARKSNGRVDGFVIESSTAGGHNAPPRGQVMLTAQGEPIYGERDEPDLARIRDLGMPFYLAGGFASPAGLGRALAAGASGIQVGTLFACCRESGITPQIRREILAMAERGDARVFTDPLASPTGFPFKVLQVPNTLSEATEYESRKRVCDVGYLRRAYRREDGTVGYRCPSEPAEDYVKKGGDLADTVGRKCLCNGLFSTIGVGGPGEPAIVTTGEDVVQLPTLLRWIDRRHAQRSEGYTAAQVLEYLLAPVKSENDCVPAHDVGGTPALR